MNDTAYAAITVFIIRTCYTMLCSAMQCINEHKNADENERGV